MGFVQEFLALVLSGALFKLAAHFPQLRRWRVSEAGRRYRLQSFRLQECAKPAYC